MDFTKLMSESKRTTFISIENPWQPYQIYGHSKLGICFYIERLVPNKTGCKSSRSVLTTS